MAAGDPLNPDQHVTHYCKPSQIDKGQATGAAFQLEGNHDELSATWLQGLLIAPRLDQLRAARSAMIASKLTLRPNGCLATLQVSAITQTIDVAGTLLQLAVRHSPTDGNDAHCGIYDMPPVGSPLATFAGAALAARVVEPIAYIRDLT